MPMREEGLTAELLHAALVGLERKRDDIEGHIAEVRRKLGGRAVASDSARSDVSAPPARKRRRMSAAARARMAQAQRKRWATAKGAGTVASVRKQPLPRSRRISAAARKDVGSTKKRWADYGASKKPGAKRAAGK